MTAEEFKQLIAQGENLHVEFKGEERVPLDDNDLVEAIVCLANRSGETPGWLLIGVEDEGRITGARPRHEGEQIDPQRVQALIANRTCPSLSCHVEVVHLEGLPVLVIQVPPSRIRWEQPTANTYDVRLQAAASQPVCPCISTKCRQDWPIAVDWITLP